MGYQFWGPIPRSASDPTRIDAFVAAELAKQDELSELADVNIPAPADTEVLTWDAGTSRWMAAAAAEPDWFSYIPIGKYHFSSLLTRRNADTSIVPGANYIRAIPYPLPVEMIVDRIGLDIQGSIADSHIRLGIYNDDGCYPNALELDAGLIDSNSTGFKVIIINKTLPAGLYWLIILCSHAVTIRGNSASLHALLGHTDGVEGKASWSKIYSYGALPDPFPSDASESTWIYGVSLRRSA